MSYVAHVLSLLALGSRFVDGVDLICKHDGPDCIAAETDSCTTEYDDGYGCARGQSHVRKTTKRVESGNDAGVP